MGAYARPTRDHPLVQGLPFAHPPVLTGYNTLEPREGADVVLEGWRVESVDADGARFAAEPAPLLVAGAHGRGRVAALAFDLAPRWSGGWTDWGVGRLDVGEGEEVGTAYRAFVERLVLWTGAARAKPRRSVEAASR
jgi:hypothetical protein